MYAKDTKIISSLGMDSKPASDFVQAAKKYRSDIYIIDREVQINAKSIMAILASALRAGTKIRLKAEGPDEIEAVNELCSIIGG